MPSSVSDDPSIDGYGPRERELRDRAAHARANTIAIFAADKVSKVRELTLLPTSHLDKTTTRAKLAHYRASLKMLRGVAGNSALVDLLDAKLNRLSHKPVTGPRADGVTTGIAHTKRSKPRARAIRPRSHQRADGREVAPWLLTNCQAAPRQR